MENRKLSLSGHGKYTKRESIRQDKTNVNGISQHYIQPIEGAANSKGVDYEIYFYLLVVLRLVINKDVKEFNVCRNIKGVGPCDDLVVNVKYILENEEKEETFFIQLKHVENITKSIPVITFAAPANVKFSFNKYYQSYQVITDKVEDFDDVILNTCNIANSMFVLYTNSRSDVGENNYSIPSIFRNLFETALEQSNIFIVNNEPEYDKLKTALEDRKSPIIEDDNFLNKFVVCASQMNVNQLKALIESLIIEYTACSNPLENLMGAIRFAEGHSKQWLSNTSGNFSNFEFNFQGCLINSRSFFESYKSHEIITKILIHCICNGNSSTPFLIGTELETPENYYVERKVELGRCVVNTQQLFNQSLVVIFAGPGIGKSWYLKRQALEIKEKNPLYFVIQAELRKYQSYLKKLNMNNGESKKKIAENFLTEISGVNEKAVEYDIYKYSLYQENMLVVFLDGIDQIYPTYYKKVVEIVKIIRAEFRVKIWISTRSNIVDKLEKDLEINAYELINFDNTDFQSYIKTYCDIENFPPNLMRSNAASTILCTTPLFCEIIAKDVKEQLENSEEGEPRDIRIFNETEVLTKYVDKTFDVLNEPLYHQIDDVCARAKVKKHKRESIDLHSKAALLAMCDKTGMKKSILKEIKKDIKPLFQEIDEGIEKIGLITTVDDGISKFVDDSLLYWFSAKYFVENQNEYGPFLTEYENKKLPPKVDAFFCAMNSEKLNKLAVLITKGCTKHQLEALVSENPDWLFKADGLGRNMIHYAVISGNREALRFMLLYDDPLSGNIMLTNENYRKYYILYRHEVRSHLLAKWIYEKQQNSKYKILAKLILLSNPYVFYYVNQLASKENLLHRAILDKNVYLMNNLLSKKSHVEETNDCDMTPLHIAAFKRDFRTIRVLMKCGVEYRNDNISQIYPHQIWNNTFYSLTSILREKYEAYIEENINRSAIQNAIFCKETLPLHEAISRKDLRDVKRLMKTVNLNSTDEIGRTPLHVAAASLSWNSAVVIFDWLLHEEVEYKEDDLGLLPHDYADDFNIRQMLSGYGFACHYPRFREEVHQIFGGTLKEIIHDEYFYGPFILGISARENKTAPFTGKNKKKKKYEEVEEYFSP